MTRSRLIKFIRRLLVVVGVAYVCLVAIMYFWQRSLLYMPSHQTHSSLLTPWLDGEQTIGYCREKSEPRAIWLMMHGNAAQAAHRDYVLQRMSNRDSLYVLEYPGFGLRPGSPSQQSINQAACDAYRLLRSQHPGVPICVLGESLGSGPACFLAGESTPPDKIVLMVPFDTLPNVASRHFSFLPVRLLMCDTWDNVQSLRSYTGPVEIFGGEEDDIIPIEHASALAGQVLTARFFKIPCGHNDWCNAREIRIEP